ncbi:leucine-rich repeat domain-containing protein [Pedobacter nototheniae]|uniref:leucine-rich repeat domain-containing protein n=1 Tax=Pedobacter nototheniae TaxID=2488994 RepID=UPI00292FF8B7|nr:leucine-rich repeat domain-containing protein [Pedobacter nototheniae]
MSSTPLLYSITPAGYLFFGTIIISIFLAYRWLKKGKTENPGCLSVGFAALIIGLIILFPVMISFQFFESGTPKIQMAVAAFWVVLIATIIYGVKNKNYKLFWTIVRFILFIIFGSLFLILVGGMAYFIYLRMFTHEQDEAPMWAVFLCIFFIAVIILAIFGLFMGNQKKMQAQAIEFKTLQEAKLNPDAVYILNLSNQNMTSFPYEVLDFKNLKSLDLSNNQLTELPFEISRMKNLFSIKLSNNPISDQQRAAIRKMFSPEVDLIFRS